MLDSEWNEESPLQCFTIFSGNNFYGRTSLVRVSWSIFDTFTRGQLLIIMENYWLQQKNLINRKITSEVVMVTALFYFY